MLRIFNNPEYLTEEEANRKYPNCKYIMKDIKDVNRVAGEVLAVSTNKKSFSELCDYFHTLPENYDVVIMGSYGGSTIGILREVE